MKSLHYFILLLVLLLGSLYVRIGVIQQHRVPSGDEGPWLRMASRVGTSEFLQSNVIEHDLYFQKIIPHPEDNRSPLYPLCIHLFYPFTKDYFLAGQILNFFTWIAFFIVSAATIRKYFGCIAALLTSMYLALSPHFILFSVHIYPDLMVALGFLVVFSYGKWFTKNWITSLVAGVGVGALLLLKATSVFILPVMLFYFFQQRIKKQWYVNTLLFVAALTIVQLPWFIRNILVFGSPVYQFSKYNLYVDNFNELLTIGTPRPSLESLIAKKGSIFVFIVRPLRGIFSMITKFPQFDEYLSLMLLPLSIFGLSKIAGRKFKGATALLIFSVPYFLFMGYVAYAAWVHRFTMIYYFLIYACAGVGVSYITNYLQAKTSVRYGFLLSLLIATVPLVRVVYPLEFYCSGRGSDSGYDICARKIIKNMKMNVSDNAVVFSTFLSDYCFLHDYKVIDNLHYRTLTDLELFLKGYNVTHFLLDKEKDEKLIKKLQTTSFKTIEVIEQIESLVLYKVK